MISPGSRVGTYYFVQAMSVGAVNAFAGIWLSSVGITAEQIGVIFAVPIFVVLFINVPVGRIADRARDWRQVIVFGALASAVPPACLLFADGFWEVLLIWSLAVVTQMVMIPVTDAASLRMSRRRGSDFGTLYAWKTVGYLLVVFGSGFLLDRYGSQAFLPIFIGLSLLRGLASLLLPNFRAADERDRRTAVGAFLRSIRPGFALPLIGWSLVSCTHSILNGFLGVLWSEQGIAADTIGILIGVSSLSETAMFFAFKRFAIHLSAHRLILASCLIAVFRWGAYAFSPGVGLLSVLQLLHAFTYVVGFLACTNFIADRATESNAAEAQSCFAAMQAATAIVALVGFGWLAGEYGARAFLVPAACAAAGALLVLVARAVTEPN